MRQMGNSTTQRMLALVAMIWCCQLVLDGSLFSRDEDHDVTPGDLIANSTSRGASPCFPGVCAILPLASASSIEMDDIAEDIAAEQETFVELSGNEPVPPAPSKSMDGCDFTKLQLTLIDASKGVTKGTNMEYKRLMNACVVFLVGIHVHVGHPILGTS
ncbi:hypothetical protein DFH29DRAFT_874485 [Suillus ampliporus]|nr:hypothetical protein DFH29DRAFT_874485 [Suillus ampliporus]